MKFGTIPYSNENLQEVWDDIEPILQKQERVHNYQLAQELDLDSYELAKTTIKYEVLPKLRDAAADQEIIEVEREETDQGNTRKVWVLQQ